VDYSKIKIILVEDNEDDANLTIMGFRSEGLDKNVVLLKDGEEALNYFFDDEAFKQEDLCTSINVILLDLHMPKVDGIQVLKKLKSEERTRKIPVVILTSSDSDPVIDECRKLGADSYIVKPVTTEGFLQVVNSLGRFWSHNYRF
jgi:two-component system, response regulator